MAEKLVLIKQFQVKYQSWINPQLISIKYCQKTAVAFLEMSFTDKTAPVILNLDFITDGDTDEITGDALPSFNPKADVVDNARVFLEMDTYSLINCMEGLLTKEAEILIYDVVQKYPR